MRRKREIKGALRNLIDRANASEVNKIYSSRTQVSGRKAICMIYVEFEK